MAEGFRIGLTQMSPTRDRDANLAIACDLVRACVGADLVLLPENCLHLGSNAEMRGMAMAMDAAPLARIADTVRETGTPVLLGGFKRKLDDGAIRNSAVLWDANGQVAAIYDKIHLFDARVAGQSFEASSVEQAGERALLLDIAGVKIGITICYDVRFPELYRRLSLAGAEVILVPSAFTQTTGAAHWHTLLRARAIENECFIIASATIRQGDGSDAFETYGHALAVDPWGEIVTNLGTAPVEACVIMLDLERVRSVREKLPVLSHVRADAYARDPAIVAIPKLQA
jgi:predicted amidohydrolase